MFVRAPLKNHTGFTLLEVLITIAVIAIALFAILRVTQQAARTTAYLQDKITADLVANDVMARVRAGLVLAPLSGGKQTGNILMLQRQWEWQLSVNNTALANIQQLTVNIKKANRVLASVVTYAAVDAQGKLFL